MQTSLSMEFSFIFVETMHRSQNCFYTRLENMLVAARIGDFNKGVNEDQLPFGPSLKWYLKELQLLSLPHFIL